LVVAGFLRAVVRRRAGALRVAFGADDFAAVVVRLAVERFAEGLRAAVEREAPVAADFARVEVLRLAVDDLAAVLRVPVERLAVVFRFAVERERDAAPELARAGAALSVHLPDNMRWAASATASAISVPSLDALAATLLAACEAVSAASRPASRIARRALGLALIAAAAAARPAASISLLIAALASLSTVALPDDREELLREDLAIASSPSVVAEKTLQRRNGSQMITGDANEGQ
jgi:hypothetical protein